MIGHLKGEKDGWQNTKDEASMFGNEFMLNRNSDLIWTGLVSESRTANWIELFYSQKKKKKNQKN